MLDLHNLKLRLLCSNIYLIMVWEKNYFFREKQISCKSQTYGKITGEWERILGVAVE